MPLIRLSPSWQHGALFHAGTGEPWPDAASDLRLPEEVTSMIGYWLTVFRELADPADPARCALLDPASATRLASEGRWALQPLEAFLGKDQVEFLPMATPVLTRHHEPGYRFMADYQCWPIWFLPESAQAGDISPDELGLSWGLARHIEQWALSFDESISLDSPAQCETLWTPQQYQEHEKEGLRLFGRLRKELDRSGRAAVRLIMAPPAERESV